MKPPVPHPALGADPMMPGSFSFTLEAEGTDCQETVYDLSTDRQRQRKVINYEFDLGAEPFRLVGRSPDRRGT
jgi:hypothetical protein